MMSAPKACRECGRPSLQGEGFCADHKTRNSFTAARAERYKHDAVSQRYNTTLWRRFRMILIRQNPICTRILKDGAQCTRPSKVGHHLWSPRKRPDLFVDPKNVIAICELCHGPEDGTEWYREGIDYVANEFAISLFV
jgi:hypothetical protein